jgi:Mg2+ and Co2+ transporter CorA
MDSVVDAFFPLIGYMEEELKLIDGFLADPISAITNTVNHTSKGHRPLDSKLNPLHHLPLAQFWSRFPWLLDWLPAFVWRESRQFVNGKGGRVSTATLGKSKNLGKVISASMSSSSPFQPKILLQRVAQSRKLATVLAKLLLPKRDVVRGMRKRNLGLGEISLYLGDLEGPCRFVSLRLAHN